MLCLLAAVTALRAAAMSRRRLAAHDALLSLFKDVVAVALPSATLHVDAAVGDLPAEYGLPSKSEFAKLRPDRLQLAHDGGDGDGVGSSSDGSRHPRRRGDDRAAARARPLPRAQALKYRRLCAATRARSCSSSPSAPTVRCTPSRARSSRCSSARTRAPPTLPRRAPTSPERPGARRVYGGRRRRAARRDAARAATRADAALRFEDMEPQATTGGRGLYHLVVLPKTAILRCTARVLVRRLGRHGPGPAAAARRDGRLRQVGTQICEHGVVHALDAEVVDGAIVFMGAPKRSILGRSSWSRAFRTATGDASGGRRGRRVIGYVRDGTELPDRFLE